MKIQSIKSLTKKQRQQIYLKAANKIRTSLLAYCCPTLQDILSKDYGISVSLGDKRFKQLLPEFNLFKPKDRTLCGVWFEAVEKYISRSKGTYQVVRRVPKNSRITCLLLCAEMCK